MNRRFTQAITLVLAGLFPAMAAVQMQNINLKDFGLSELKQHLADIDSEVNNLASLTLRRGVGSLGYRSETYSNSNSVEWIFIELEEETIIDEVILIPALYSESETGLQSEGFPRAFRILAGTGRVTNEVAVVTQEKQVLPRIAPMAISFPPTKASWVLLETSTLSPRLHSNHYFLQLSEIMVFSGLENVALNQPVSVPAHTPAPDNSIDSRFLIDGFTPFILDAAHGAQSKSQLIHVADTNQTPTITLDLKATYPINQINFHSASLSYAIPMENFSSWAVPRHVRVVGANQPDFSDAVLLCEYRQETIFDNGPIIMRRFPETRCRYINIEIMDPESIVSLKHDNTFISFSEIEVLSHGTNVALHAPVTVSTNLYYPKDSLIRITDGVNYYGEILPLKVWMNELSRRHDLETARPIVIAELNRRYDRQKINLALTRWLAAALAVGIVISMLIGRMLRMHQLTRMQERFAADLHDELGADLHTIGLLSDLAGETSDDPQELSQLLKQIRTTTEETGEAVRQCATMHTEVPYLNLGETMKQIAQRVVVQLDHEFILEGAEHLNKLKPIVRSDLFLFYKEALINICRHAEASELSTHLLATAKEVRLTISDNGQGLPDFASLSVPKSLLRRAQLMGAKVEVKNKNAAGTCILLTLKTSKRIHSFRRKS
jgi:signal transduction histidine kinase